MMMMMMIRRLVPPWALPMLRYPGFAHLHELVHTRLSIFKSLNMSSIFPKLIQEFIGLLLTLLQVLLDKGICKARLHLR